MIACPREWHDRVRATPFLWTRCHLVGFWTDGRAVYESRNCPRCGSTLELRRRSYVWCPGRNSTSQGHPVLMTTPGLETDALGRTWCAPCQRAEEIAALEDAKSNDGLLAVHERRDT